MNNEEIKTIIKGLAEKMAVSIDDIDITKDDTTGHTVATIKSQESGLLIGTKGTIFSALNHLLKKMVAKKFNLEDANSFSVNVNDYREKGRSDIEKKARMMAERAISFKCNIEMEPMSSYERMCVHSYLKGMKNIKTESAGMGKDRHVVIKFSEEEIIV